jgi:hypothetical protein
MNAKKSFTTKLTKGTKGLEKLMIVPNFVLFVSFVVRTSFRPTSEQTHD